VPFERRVGDCNGESAGDKEGDLRIVGDSDLLRKVFALRDCGEMVLF
jgi:hypothetical protein